MLNRSPAAADRRRWLPVVLMALVLLGAENSCGAMAVLQACNGDEHEAAVVLVRVGRNEMQQTLPPGVCVTSAAPFTPIDVVQPYRVAPLDPVKYRAGMSTLRDDVEPRIFVPSTPDETVPPELVPAVLGIPAQIELIREASIGEACSGTLNAGESLKVTVVRNASGVWSCGAMELTTPEPSSTSQ